MAGKQVYSMGHGKEATSSHASRTPESDAAFLLPHLKPDDQVLDLGCGPGTITTGFCSYVPQGFVTGIDISPQVLNQATDLAKARPEGYPTNLDFFAVDVLKDGWADDRPDKTASAPSAVPITWKDRFDVVYESQCFCHIPDPVGAIKKLIPCVKEGGLFAMRDYDCATFIFSPDPTGVLQRWSEYQSLILTQEGSPNRYGGRALYSHALAAGLLPDKIEIGQSCLLYKGKEQRKWWGGLHRDRLAEGKGQRQILIEKCRISPKEIDELRDAISQWIEDPAGIFSATAFEIIAHV